MVSQINSPTQWSSDQNSDEQWLNGVVETNQLYRRDPATLTGTHAELTNKLKAKSLLENQHHTEQETSPNLGISTTEHSNYQIAQENRQKLIPFLDDNSLNELSKMRAACIFLFVYYRIYKNFIVAAKNCNEIQLLENDAEFNRSVELMKSLIKGIDIHLSIEWIEEFTEIPTALSQALIPLLHEFCLATFDTYEVTYPIDQTRSPSRSHRKNTHQAVAVAKEALNSLINQSDKEDAGEILYGIYNLLQCPFEKEISSKLGNKGGWMFNYLACLGVVEGEKNRHTSTFPTSNEQEFLAKFNL